MGLQYPLHYSAALVAAIIALLLSSMQPALLKVLINAILDQSESDHIKAIIAFMTVGILISFAFEAIQVAIAHRFRLEIEARLRSAYLYVSNILTDDQKNRAVRRGIYQITQISVSLTLDLVIIIINIMLISFFMMLENMTLGLSVIALSILALVSNQRIVKILARVSGYKEDIKSRVLNTQNNPERYQRLTTNIQRFDRNILKLETLAALLNTVTFKLSPIVFILMLHLRGVKDVASISTIFLYLGMLQKPFMKLSYLLKEYSISRAQTELIENEIILGLKLTKVESLFPCGAIYLGQTHVEQQINKEIKDNSILIINKSLPSKNELALLADFISLNSISKRVLVVGHMDYHNLCHFKYNGNRCDVIVGANE